MGGVTTRCPCCGHAAEFDRPLVDLNSNVISFRGATVRVRPKVAEFVSVVAERHPAPVSRSTVIGRLWGVDEPATAEAGVRLLAYQARQATKGFGFDLRDDRCRGYRLIVG